MKKAPEKIKVKILRFNPEVDSSPHYESFEVPLSPDLTVLESLYYILENYDASLAFRSSCRAAVCGSCAMKINGHYALACQTLIRNLRTKTIILEPLAHLPVIKDLVVDMTRFYEKYEYIEPFLVPKEIPAGKEFYQSPEERKKIDGLVECILCGACYAACTMVKWNPDFPGPFAFLAANARLRDTRDEKGRERLLKLIDESGIWRCHTQIRCTDVCPKNLSPTEAINSLKREAVIYRFYSKLKKRLKCEEVAPSLISPPPEVITPRRNFLKTVFLGGIALITGAFLSLFSIPLMSRPKRNTIKGWIKVGLMPELEIEKPFEIIYHVQRWERGELVSYPKRAYIIKNKSGEINGIDPICTHLGCTCYWDESIRMFMCPCHGGAFDINGRVTLGPPPQALKRLQVKVEDNILYLCEVFK